MKRTQRLVVVAVAILALTGVVAAATLFSADSGVSYEAPSGLEVTAGVSHDVQDSNPFIDSETLYLDGVTVSSAGETSVTIDQFTGSRTTLSSIDATNATISVDPDDKSAVLIDGQVTDLAWEDASLDGTAQITYSADGDGTITATGLQSDTAFAAATTTGEVLTTGTTSASGEATINVSAATDSDIVLLKPSSPELSNGQPNTDTTRYEDQTLQIDLNDGDFGTDAGDDVTLEWYVDGNLENTTTATANGTVSADVGPFDDGTHEWQVVATDDYGEAVTSANFTWTIEHAAPEVSNRQPADGSALSEREQEFSIDISDSDFAFDGDTVDATLFIDGESVGSETLSANGSASITTTISEGGGHEYYWVVSDRYGLETTTSTFSFDIPSELRIYNESSPDNLVDNVTVEILFYGGPDGDQFTFQRETSNGVVDMSGLPVDQEFVVVASADGYNNRRIYVESLFQQASVFLLPESSTAAYNVFQIDDKSGSYPPGETRLIIQRGLNKSGNFSWYTVSGDFFGGTNSHETYLRYNQRYRLIVENNQGDRRVIGAYMALDESNPKVITISSIVVSPPDGQNYYANTWIDDATEDDGKKTLKFSYNDPDKLTDSLDLVIHERGNVSNVLDEISTDNVGDSWTVSYALEGADAETSWVVDWSGQREGNEIGQRVPVGEEGNIPIPISSEWLTRFGLVALPVVAALSSERIATLGAMGTVAFAGILMISGIWEIPVLLWFAALVIALGGHALTMARRGSVFG